MFEFVDIRLGNIGETDMQGATSFCQVPEDVAEFGGDFVGVQVVTVKQPLLDQVGEFSAFAGCAEGGHAEALTKDIIWAGGASGGELVGVEIDFGSFGWAIVPNCEVYFRVIFVGVYSDMGDAVDVVARD